MQLNERQPSVGRMEARDGRLCGLSMPLSGGRWEVGVGGLGDDGGRGSVRDRTTAVRGTQVREKRGRGRGIQPESWANGMRGGASETEAERQASENASLKCDHPSAARNSRS